MQLHRENREATESGCTLIDFVPAKPKSEIARTCTFSVARFCSACSPLCVIIFLSILF